MCNGPPWGGKRSSWPAAGAGRRQCSTEAGLSLSSRVQQRTLDLRNNEGHNKERFSMKCHAAYLIQGLGLGEVRREMQN